MINDQNLLAWLKEGSAYRSILVVAGCNVNGVEIQRYLSTVAYTTTPLDAPANQAFLPVIIDGVRLEEKVDMDGAASMSFGDIEIMNLDGSLDGWLNDIWRNHTIRIYIGDVRWVFGAFKLVFDGIIHDIDSRSRDRLNLILRDKMERLNAPLTDHTIKDAAYGDAAPAMPELADELRPLVFGECFNISPVLVDEANHHYLLHDGASPIEDVIEVRDNGIKVSHTENNLVGLMTLSQNPAGTITCSVQGDNSGGYRNTPAGLIRHIVKNFGKAGSRFTDEDIDTTSFAAFDQFGGPGYVYIGAYYTDRINVLEVITQMAAACRGILHMNRAGQLRLFQLKLPAAGAQFTINDTDIMENSLSIAQRFPVQAVIRLNYCKNWTVQNEVAGGVNARHKNLYKKEWLQVKVRDAAVKDKYKLDECPEGIDTLLLTKADALEEAGHRLALWKVQRYIYRFRTGPVGLFYELGDSVKLVHDRFGLENGKDGMIVGLEPDWINGEAWVEVFA